MASDSPPGARPRVALVLAGGGALGAYEAGVLHYLLSELPQRAEIRGRFGFDVLCGTSVGALNACFVAAAARSPATAAASLSAFWRSLTFDQVLRFGANELSAALSLLFGVRRRGSLRRHGRPRLRATPHEPVAGLFDTSPLRRLMQTLVPWGTLSDNVASGLVQGVAVCATEICTGMSVIFYQTNPATRYRAGRDPSKIARRVRLSAEHAMASASVPFLFPAVQIDGVCYTDGALRQNTPLNPALRMGANRVLVVSVAQDPEVASCVARIGCRQNPFPGALFLLGKTVGILLTQSLDYELKRIETYNKLIDGGRAIYGPDFADRLNGIIGPHRNADYRPIRTCHVRPTENIHRIALDALERAPGEIDLPGLPGRILGSFFRTSVFTESELLETLMFTPTFVRELVDLGYENARAQRDSLAALFVD